jgi:hypothetical protein
LLSHSQDNLIKTLTDHVSLSKAACTLDYSTLLVEKLEQLRSNKVESGTHVDAGYGDLKEEKYAANLVHLLRRLQHILFQVLVHRSITRLDELALHWYTYWQQQKKVDEGWFNEWPCGQRPLSTTWPWNIRPSLMVLWGVCWKFYPPEPTDREKVWPPTAQQQLVDESAIWNFSDSFIEELDQGTSKSVEDLALGDRTKAISPWQPGFRWTIEHRLQDHLTQSWGPSLPLTRIAPLVLLAPDVHSHRLTLLSCSRLVSHHPRKSDPGNNANITKAGTVEGGLRHASMTGFDRGLGISNPTTQRPSLCPDAVPLPVNAALYPSPFDSADCTPWSGSPGGNIQAPNSTSHKNFEQGSPDALCYQKTPVPSTYPPPTPFPTLEISPAAAKDYVPTSNLITTEIPYARVLGTPYLEFQAMGSSDMYPSPLSEAGRQPPISSPALPPEPVVAEQDTAASSDGGRGPRGPIQRGDPPRNALNEIYCDHPECATTTQTFLRRCEWR